MFFISGINKEKIMQISFGKVIEIYSDTDNIRKKKVDLKTQETLYTMRSNESSIYDKETSLRIGDFLRTQIQDESYKTGFLIRKLIHGTYLFTGDDAKAVRKIEDDTKKELKAYNKKISKGITEDMSNIDKADIECKALRKIRKQNIFLRERKAIEKLADKWEDRIILEADEQDRDNISKIKYISKDKYFYQAGYKSSEIKI